ncbi:replication protein [Bacillus sp. FJAT-49705]|uniref:Replication protein n=1 Tax=Cytobacillus citreus TaxID=2833586 RepID=A0ABS5NLH7_9BACI|nr:replication protein [Cytobacillus citreus]MBS4188679.1 replication protein [Cytobacillus citreus]
MASPQTKNGYTRIANEILESISKADLNGTQLKIVMVIWRYTYGFRRKEHEISLAFLAEAIGSTKSHVDKELTTLIERKIVNVVGVGERRGRLLAYNKNYDDWIDRPTDAVPQSSSCNCSTSSSCNCSTSSSTNCSTKKEKVKEKPKKTRQTKKYDEESSYYKMALYFHEKVSAVAKDAGVEHLVRNANLQSWADDFRKLIEKDGVDKRLAKEVMDWVTQDSFWRTNVLSAKTLRGKFAELAIKKKASQTPKQPIQQQTKNDIRDKEIEFQRWISEGNDPDAFDWGK